MSEKEDPPLQGVLDRYRSELSRIDVDLPGVPTRRQGRKPSAPLALPHMTEGPPDIVRHIDSLRLRGDISTRLRTALGWLVPVAAVGAILALAVPPAHRFLKSRLFPPPPAAPAPKAPAPPAAPAVPDPDVASIPFPAGRPAGLAVRGGIFLSVDVDAGKLVILDPGNAKLTSRIPFPNPSVDGLAVGEGDLWSTDSSGGWIYRHDPLTCEVKAKFRGPGGHPAALHWDGEALWTADGEAGRIYRHKPGNGMKVVFSAKTRGEHPSAIARVGDFLWVAGADMHTITRYRIGEDLKPYGTARLADLARLKGRVVGLSVEDRWVWIMTDSQPALHRIPREKLRF